ncbi:MAG: glycosyltransferase family 2 protein [Myxococcota bacterium]|nr:glycosyltransferase family 2 protein [Myxococcota bacterium]
MTIPSLSLIVPAYDEEDCLVALYGRVLEVFGNGLAWELVVVDDGSRDRTGAVARELAEKDPRVRAHILTRNCGQTTAIRVGIAAARGPLVATLDADLQNDPGDLLAMLEALGENDAVVGYRTERHDDWLRRTSSRVANAIRNALTGDQVRDTGCSLKLVRTEAIRAIPLFEGMHRFLPTLLRYHGYRVIEHPVSHRPRLAGTSKYGVSNRAWRAFKDLLAVRWMRSRIVHPEVRGSDEP